ncbi:Dot/Icm T4SS effector kinase LegK1 [Legionella bononiensis]|uniref:Protein kinase n=1 Tax=Legionella bononiensis TaxID=2793102 RepID=A0ABS1WF70_9GAMM|nr:Dot/Icm T4SS effector kinase LegK1 [Legionella bononiensis]MBL7479273.1 protein kinase [Legionella bononiensis]MBL7527999.1 protein kinase [Legionella bononiensis]MBL7563924.1 protein kinase [Legionella bononiensis]
MIPTLQITINPEQFYNWNAGTSNDELVLNSFLQSSASEGVWHSKQSYEYTFNNTHYKFNFTQSFIKRQRKEGKSGYKVSIFDTSKTPLGKGGYAVVYPIISTFIRYDEGQIHAKSGRPKLVKIQDHSEIDKTQSIHNEYEKLVQAGHLRVKKPIFSEYAHGKKSYLIIEQAQGYNLEQILNPQKRKRINDKIPRLSIDKRLGLTIAILNAIKSQVMDRKLVHRDIKPGNIMIDLNQDPPKVILIDYGFAIDQGQQDFRRLGTRAYRSPESFKSKPIYTTSSDIYSAGRVLSYLWGDDHQNYYIRRSKEYDYIKTKSTNEQLFSLPEIQLYLDEVDQNKIKGCLNRMLAEHPLERPSIDEVITLFSNIDREHYKDEDTTKYDISCLNEFEHKTNLQIILIKRHLNIMRNKEKDLRNRNCTAAADVMQHLEQTMTRNTEYLEEHLNPSVLLRYRKKCLSAINGAKNTLSAHRDVHWILAETAMALALLGMGYLIALGINYYLTGRLGFFSQTKSDQITDSLKNIVSIDLSSA